ncbi:dTDP-glucose 4,6-dehydratase [Vibrio brasiliensis]
MTDYFNVIFQMKTCGKTKCILVTGGSGFIGSATIRYLIDATDHFVVNLDKLSYAVDSQALADYSSHERYKFIHGDICDQDILEKILSKYQPLWIINLAAETHVDTSIYYPKEFVRTNVIGTYTLLQASLAYWWTMTKTMKNQFRFLHVSTDEVFGDLKFQKSKFNENSTYDPSSPYSATKASADHLVRAWGRTYNFPFLITNCTNNYGPYQHSEKLIPKTIERLLKKNTISIYGSGLQVRDWLHVTDHVLALHQVLKDGIVGETYCIGGNCEKTNIEVIKLICNTIDSLENSGYSHENLITYTKDREGHDFRYAVCTKKIRKLGWKPSKIFEDELSKLVKSQWRNSNRRRN